MGCTDATEHIIELLPEQDELFKERFRRIAPGRGRGASTHTGDVGWRSYMTLLVTLV